MLGSGPVLVSALLAAQQPAPKPTTAAEALNRDTNYIDAQGTAHVTRVVPVPKTISTEAQRRLSRPEPDQGPPQSLADRRKGTDAYTARARVEWSRLCPNQLVEEKIAGVPVRIVTPEGLPAANRDRVFLNLHGGGFNSDSGSYTESIPIATYSKIKVVAVYKELLRTYKPNHIVIYGTSAGAILTAEVAARLKQLGLPLPELPALSTHGSASHGRQNRRHQDSRRRMMLRMEVLLHGGTQLNGWRSADIHQAILTASAYPPPRILSPNFATTCAR